jgi:hypothetical protein
MTRDKSAGERRIGRHNRASSMSRDISIGYRYGDGPETAIEIRAPYFLFGTQSTSKKFWSLPKVREIGIEQLAELGMGDPIYFDGWEMMADLRREMELLHEHMADIEFDPDIKASWLVHLMYCYHLLVLMAPKDSTPMLTIG